MTMIDVSLLAVEQYPRLADIVDLWAQEKPEAMCLQEIGKSPCTYAQLKREMDALAAGLHGLGVSKNNCVLTMLDNGLACIESWLAINKLGAIDVPVHTAYKPQFIRHMMRITKAEYIILNGQYLETVLDSLETENESPVTLIVVGEEPADTGHAAAVPSRVKRVDYDGLKIPDAAVPDIAVHPDDTSVVLFTSGTKNGTQGAILTYRLLRNISFVTIQRMKLTGDDIAYVCFPLSHGNGKFTNVGTLFTVGGAAVVANKFSASRWIHDIHNYRITYTSLMGPMAEFVYNQPPTDLDRNHALRIILNIPRSPEFTPKFEKRFGVECYEVYGATGLAGVISEPPGAKNYASCGKLVEENWEARIVDTSTGQDVHPGETGELWLKPKRAGMMMPGYYNDEESFQQAWHGEWYMTGDLMSRDDRGFYYYKGRSGDFIRRRGENVSVKEVEKVMKQAEGVREAVVFGVPTEFETGEEDVMAAVEGEGVQLEPLIEYCRNALPFFAVPRYFLLGELPRLPDQSVDKAMLKQRGVTSDTFDRNKKR